MNVNQDAGRLDAIKQTQNRQEPCLTATILRETGNATLMKVEPLDDQDFAKWDAFAARSPDAWFWHTSHWMNYTRAYAGKSFQRNLSFWVTRGGAKLAIVPCFLEIGPAVLSLYHDDVDGSDRTRLTYAGVPLPAPALSDDLNAQGRWEVLEFIVSHLKQLASDHGVETFQLISPALAPGFLGSSLPVANPFSRFGALDISRATQIIDLRTDAAKLWTAVRHGHQYDIRRGERALTVKIWHGNEMPASIFEEYRALHAKDAGRVTRSEETFLMMRDWIHRGEGALAQVMKGDQSVGFILLIIYRNGAFYASGCRDPDDMKLPVFHVAQWQLIQWLKQNDVWFYDIGVQQFSKQWYDNPSSKHMNISMFKRGFGGTTVPLHASEFHLTEAGLRNAISYRLDKTYGST